MFSSSVNYLRNAKNLIYSKNLCQVKLIAIKTSFLNPGQKIFLPCLDIVAGKKSYTAELGLPEPPKKPMPAFLRYSKEEFKKFTNTKYKDALVKIGETWRSLPESEKAKYLEEASSEAELYKQKLSKYKESLTPDQIKEEEKLRTDQRIAKLLTLKKQIIRRDNIALGKPKHPGIALSIFFDKFIKEGNMPEESRSNTLKYVVTQWQNMSEAEKQSYREEAKNRQLKYREDLEKWEKKMLESGRSDLVRKITLKQIKK